MKAQSYYKSTQIVTGEQKPGWAWPWSNKVRLEKGGPSSPAFSAWQEQGSRTMRSLNFHRSEKQLSTLPGARKSWKECSIRHSSSQENMSRPARHGRSAPLCGLLEQVSTSLCGWRSGSEGRFKQRWSLRAFPTLKAKRDARNEDLDSAKPVQFSKATSYLSQNWD